MIFPHSRYPTDVDNQIAGFDTQYDFEGMGVIASFSAECIWRLRFQLPRTFPIGTPKLLIRALGNADTGFTRLEPKWNFADSSTDLSGVSLTTEGTSDMSWVDTGGDYIIEELITLDANAWTGNEGAELLMDLTFLTASTLAADSWYVVSIIWE